MPMTVVVSRNLPDRFRGFLASCMCEVAPGVYTAPRMTAAVRERVWVVLADWFQSEPDQGLLMTWPDSTRPGGQAIETLGWPRQELEEHGGVFLSRRSARALAPDSPQVMEATAWARELAARADWVVLDTETTSTGPGAEPLEIVVLAADGKVLLSTLVKPEGPIEPTAVDLHGLDASALEAAPSFAEVLPALRQAIEGRTVVAYNAAFDRRVLLAASRRAHQPEVPADWHCALQRYRQRRGILTSLREACELEEIAVEGAHRAEVDARLLLTLIRCLAESSPAST
jgi:CRISPR-associated protein Cas2